MWNLVSVCLETVFVWVQDRCMVCTKRTIVSEIILDAPNELIGDVGHVESCFGPFGGSASVSARYMYGMRQTYHRLIKSFWMHLMVLLGDEAQVEARFSSIGDSSSPDAR